MSAQSRMQKLLPPQALPIDSSRVSPLQAARADTEAALPQDRDQIVDEIADHLGDAFGRPDRLQ